MGDALKDARRPDGTEAFNAPVALSVMVFFALCCQCVSTLVVIRRETNSSVLAGIYVCVHDSAGLCVRVGCLPSR